MLCQFTFQNFKSYKERTTFDFQAEAIPEFSDSLLHSEGGSELLPVSVIYGPNGGGKTNLLYALSCMITAVVKPIRDLEKNRNELIYQHAVNCEPFLFDEISPQQPIEFEMFFRTGGNEYRYCLALRDEIVEAESLFWRKLSGGRIGTVFTREGSEIDLGPIINRSGTSRSVNPKMPYLSFLAINHNFPIIAEVQSWFESCVIQNYGTLKRGDGFLVLGKPDDPDNRKEMIQVLNDMGVDLTDYRFDKDAQRLYTQRVVHGKMYELEFWDESEGTRKLMITLPVLLIALREGRLVIMDELDAKLHPKLLRYVISMFKNPRLNTKGAQLLFTSHDMTTMKNTVFRRDEIWFAAENEEHESEIYSLYEIRRENNERVNNTASYDKQYLEGRYGADPYLTNMLAGGEWP